MRYHRPLTLLTLSAACLSLHAQPSKPPETEALCKAAESQIEEQAKTLAFEDVAGIGDTSAPRESVRQTKIVAAGVMIQVHMAHMTALGCKPIQWTISPIAFGAEPMLCAMARSAGMADKGSCDRKAWSRDKAKRAPDAPAPSPSLYELGKPSTPPDKK